MTYLSVIAAAGAAALIAGQAPADDVTGQSAGKRIHKPANSATGMGVHKPGGASGGDSKGWATGKRRHKPLVAAAPAK
ncbi:MAG TPA: hypothetical protein VGF71_06480 [Caulobacteraceae bacterium]|jgi:hypothetical protein